MFNVDNLTSLFLGQQGENLATEIRIDMSTWLEDNADLTIYMVAIRHGEAAAYVPATTMDEMVLVWPITSYDTAIVGTGLCQIVASDGTRIVKAKRIRTAVGTVIPGTDEDTAPEPIDGWIDALLAQMAVIRTDVLQAQDAAEDAAETATTARTEAVAASEAAQTAAAHAEEMASIVGSCALRFHNSDGTLTSNAIADLTPTTMAEIVLGDSIPVNMYLVETGQYICPLYGIEYSGGLPTTISFMHGNQTISFVASGATSAYQIYTAES